MLLTVLGRAATKIITEGMRQTGIKPRHVAALRALKQGSLTQQALGEAVDIDATQLVGLLNELEARAIEHTNEGCSEDACNGDTAETT